MPLTIARTRFMVISPGDWMQRPVSSDMLSPAAWGTTLQSPEGGMRPALLALAAGALAALLARNEPADLKPLLERPILPPRQALLDAQEFCDARVPRMKEESAAEEWQRQADQFRA